MHRASSAGIHTSLTIFNCGMDVRSFVRLLSFVIHKKSIVVVVVVLTRSRGGAWPRDAAVTRTGKQAGKALCSQGHHYARVM